MTHPHGPAGGGPSGGSGTSPRVYGPATAPVALAVGAFVAVALSLIPILAR